MKSSSASLHCIHRNGLHWVQVTSIHTLFLCFQPVINLVRSYKQRVTDTHVMQVFTYRRPKVVAAYLLRVPSEVAVIYNPALSIQLHFQPICLQSQLIHPPTETKLPRPACAYVCDSIQFSSSSRSKQWVNSTKAERLYTKTVWALLIPIQSCY